MGDIGKKRIANAAIGAALCMLICLAACNQKGVMPYGGGQGESAYQDSRTAAQKAQQLLPKKLVKVGFVQVGHESDWRIAATESCREAFSEESGFDLHFVDADNDPDKQAAAVRKFIQEQMDYIVVDPIVTTGWTAVLKEASHAGIPVILLDRTVDCDSRYYTAWFGSDFVREGEYAGKWLEGYLKLQGRQAEEIRIVTINGTQGASAQIGRTQGFGNYLGRNPNWRLLAEDCGDFTESGGRLVMEGYLERFSDIDVVICQNDNEAFGACEALDESGISYGRDGDVIVISFDATKSGLKAVLDGKINADIECNPLSPPYAAQAIRRMEVGMALEEKHYYLPEECFSSGDGLITLYMDDEVKRMVEVTHEVIKRREY